MGNKTYGCPVEAAIDVIGGKWKAPILWWLYQQTRRFAELRRLMPRITEKMPRQQLRELERDGVVHRRVYAAVPPRVEYSLTEYGFTLQNALEAVCEWGRVHMERLEHAEATAVKNPTLGVDADAR